MFKRLLLLLMPIFLIGCASVPEMFKGHLAISLGKKCDVTDNGVLITSYVWFYDGRDILDASKDLCIVK
tara:strand:- start:586 stop:792 length:207 start_codon:yes stop_codon:yes gene_type:complete